MASIDTKQKEQQNCSIETAASPNITAYAHIKSVESNHILRESHNQSSQHLIVFMFKKKNKI